MIKWIVVIAIGREINRDFRVIFVPLFLILPLPPGSFPFWFYYFATLPSTLSAKGQLIPPSLTTNLRNRSPLSSHRTPPSSSIVSHLPSSLRHHPPPIPTPPHRSIHTPDTTTHLSRLASPVCELLLPHVVPNPHFRTSHPRSPYRSMPTTTEPPTSNPFPLASSTPGTSIEGSSTSLCD